MGRLVSPTKRKRSVSPASKDLHHTPDTPTLPAALYRPLEAPAKAEFADFKERRNPFKGDHLKLSKLILSRPQDQIKEDSQALTRRKYEEIRKSRQLPAFKTSKYATDALILDYQGFYPVYSLLPSTA
jgi:hypothetical protein